jgi:hypothetical protein
MESQDKNIKWSELSSVKIKIQLNEYKNHHEYIKNQISILLEKIDEIEKNYNNASDELFKRKNGII